MSIIEIEIDPATTVLNRLGYSKENSFSALSLLSNVPRSIIRHGQKSGDDLVDC
jgi:hypothetical protein